MLRINVDHDGGAAYAIPPDNPDIAGAKPETWAVGLRNPWRFSWTPDGRMVLADVGQDVWEEVNIVKKGDNLGWNIREGRHCFRPKTDCGDPDALGLTEPVYEYGHAEGQALWDAAGEKKGLVEEEA